MLEIKKIDLQKKEVIIKQFYENEKLVEEDVDENEEDDKLINP